MQVAGHRKHRCGEADVDARLVHHLEHAREPLVRLAEQLADALAMLAKVEHRRGRALATHLVDESRQRDIIRPLSLWERAGLRASDRQPVLRHDEQRNPFHPRR